MAACGNFLNNAPDMVDDAMPMSSMPDMPNMTNPNVMNQVPHIPDMPNPMPHIPDMPNPMTPPYEPLQHGGYHPQPEPQPLPAPIDNNYAPVDNNYAPVAHPVVPDEDCRDCAQLVKTMKQVQVPCTRNTYRQFEVKVPRVVNERVPRTVKYIDYENRDKTVHYTVNRTETRYRNENQQYMVDVPKTRTRTVNVTKKVPKTIYVDVTEQVEQQYTIVEKEPRTRVVRIPYTVDVPQQLTKVVQEKVPVERMKTEYSDVQRTVYETQIKRECVPVTKLVTKSIPVYEYRPLPARPCGPPVRPVEPVYPVVPVQPKITVKTEYKAPKKYDTNNDGILDEEERKLAAAQGELEVVKREVVDANEVPAGAPVQKDKAVYEAPAAFDANKDGILQKDEAATAAAAGQLRRRPTSSSRRRTRRTGGSRSRSGSRGSSSSRRNSGRRRRRN